MRCWATFVCFFASFIIYCVSFVTLHLCMCTHFLLSFFYYFSPGLASLKQVLPLQHSHLSGDTCRSASIFIFFFKHTCTHTHAQTHPHPHTGTEIKVMLSRKCRVYNKINDHIWNLMKWLPQEGSLLHSLQHTPCMRTHTRFPFFPFALFNPAFLRPSWGHTRGSSQFPWLQSATSQSAFSAGLCGAVGTQSASQLYI